MTQMNSQTISVKSINPGKSVILTNYDIIKANEEAFMVKTEEGEGTTFIVELPLNNIEYE